MKTVESARTALMADSPRDTLTVTTSPPAGAGREDWGAVEINPDGTATLY